MDTLTIGKKYFFELENGFNYTGIIQAADDTHIQIIDKFGKKRTLKRSYINQADEMQGERRDVNGPSR